MKFDMLCNIILNEAKGEKFAKLVLGNQNPVFTKEDILRDPTDPSKGTMMYLSGKDEKRRGWAVGSDQSVKRQIRRLNWVARGVIKRMVGKEEGLSIEKVHELITQMLERYQTIVLGQKVDKANTGYEVRVIGNMLLPPTSRNPQGKSVLIVPGMDPNATPAAAKTPIPTTQRERRTNKIIKTAPVTADEVFRKWEDVAEFFEQLLDTDLLETIRDIVENGGQTSIETEEPVAEEPTAEEPVATEAPVGEAVEGEDLPVDNDAIEEPADETDLVPTEEPVATGTAPGVTLRDIINNPRIKGIFDPRAVKLAIKGMMKGGELAQDEEGFIYSTGNSIAGSKSHATGGAIEAEPEEIEMAAAKFGEEEPKDADLKAIEDEENIEPEIANDAPAWYPKVEKEPEEEPAADEEEEKSSDEWWK